MPRPGGRVGQDRITVTAGQLPGYRLDSRVMILPGTLAWIAQQMALLFMATGNPEVPGCHLGPGKTLIGSL